MTPELDLYRQQRATHGTTMHTILPTLLPLDMDITILKRDLLMLSLNHGVMVVVTMAVVAMAVIIMAVVVIMAFGVVDKNIAPLLHILHHEK